MTEKVDYTETAKLIILLEKIRKGDFTERNGQVVRQAGLISEKSGLNKQEVFDALITELKRLDNEGYNPLLEKFPIRLINRGKKKKD